MTLGNIHLNKSGLERRKINHVFKTLLHLNHTQEESEFRCSAHRDSGNFVRVARLLVYMCPPTSMCTGALDLVSCAGVGMPWLLKGDTGDRVIMGLDMLERLSCEETQQNITP